MFFFVFKHVSALLLINNNNNKLIKQISAIVSVVKCAQTSQSMGSIRSRWVRTVYINICHLEEASQFIPNFLIMKLAEIT